MSSTLMPAALHAGPRVDDAFVRNAPAAPAVEHRERAFETLGDIVGVEDSDAGRLGQPAAAHQQAIAPGDRQNRSRAIGRGRDRSLAARLRIAGQERDQMGLHADGPHAWSTAAVRDAEGLVQVEVAHVGADVARACEPDQRVQVGAVEIDLAAMRVDDVADLPDAPLEHAVRRRIGDHAGRKPFPVQFGLGAEILDVDIAVAVGADHDDAHPAHLGRGRIGAVRRGGDQADVAVRLAARQVIGPDGKKPGIFALGPGIRLHRDRVIARDGAELCREIGDQLRDSPAPDRPARRDGSRKIPARRSAASRRWR